LLLFDVDTITHNIPTKNVVWHLPAVMILKLHMKAWTELKGWMFLLCIGGNSFYDMYISKLSY